ncbi:hypothetical protein WBJ53_32810 (plasmid) [Spirosoma sp. SC4-14]|uniref:hypothetical protein n=1 Tax=Spirosoma sp. SC4-14 TaxID=3128900 RepID=UPI0030D47AF1
MKITKPISIKPTLLGESIEFLHQEDMTCIATTEGIVELVSQLVYYKEEGKALFPEIYIFDDLELVKKVLPTSQVCSIGKGGKSKETMLKALKKCAPLTEGGWAIYILRKLDSFEYGVIRAGTSILSVSISELLIDNGSNELKAVLIHQVAEKVIEVKGVNADTLVINFGSHTNSINSPTKNQLEFIETIVAKVDIKLKDPTLNFFQKVFLEVLQKGHGTLSCVISSKKSYPKRLQDGILLEHKLNIPDIIRELLDKDDLVANSKLQGSYSLLSGMLQSDGITVFSDRGEIISYNVFIKHPEKILKSTTSGGARSRTFLTLCEMVGSGLESAFIQSQDGNIEFKKNGK